MDFQVNGNPGDSCATLTMGNDPKAETASDCSGMKHIAICQTICKTTLCLPTTDKGFSVPHGHPGDNMT